MPLVVLVVLQVQTSEDHRHVSGLPQADCPKVFPAVRTVLYLLPVLYIDKINL